MTKNTSDAHSRTTVSPPVTVNSVHRSDGALLARNIRIHNQDDLTRLEKLGASQYILPPDPSKNPDEVPADDTSLDAAELEVVDESPEEIKSSIRKHQETYERTIDLMKVTFPKVTNGSVPEEQLDRIQTRVKSFIRTARHEPASLAALTQLKVYDDCTFQHSLNVSLLATLYGTYRNFEQNELFTLAIGALFHDIGKTQLPEEVIQSTAPLSEKERNIVEGHARKGRDGLRDLKLDPTVAQIAYEHHERPDGSGYPEGKVSIHLFSRITGICDVYEALTARRPYKEPCHPLQAFTVLKDEYGDYFETRRVANGLMHALGIFPVGSYVELNSGERGFVSKNFEEDLRRPNVIITTDRQGKVLEEPYPVDLLKAARRKYGTHREIYDDGTFIETILPIRDHPLPEDDVCELLEESFG